MLIKCATIQPLYIQRRISITRHCAKCHNQCEITFTLLWIISCGEKRNVSVEQTPVKTTRLWLRPLEIYIVVTMEGVTAVSREAAGSMAWWEELGRRREQGKVVVWEGGVWGKDWGRKKKSKGGRKWEGKERPCEKRCEGKNSKKWARKNENKINEIVRDRGRGEGEMKV